MISTIYGVHRTNKSIASILSRTCTILTRFPYNQAINVMSAMKDSKVSGIRINPDLNKYDNIVLFPELLAKANALLKKAGPPKFPESKSNY